jgi:excisionase family DNA binding protein
MAENKATDPNEMLSAKDAGKILGVSGKTVIRMMRDGEFPGYDMGTSGFKFRRGEIEAYLESRRVQGEKQDSAA